MDLFHDTLGRLTISQDGRNRRVSSNEQPAWNDGNFDMTPLDPGQRFELPLLTGAGVITHIWMTTHAGRAHELNSLSLRIYWDGREQPDVEVPLGDFFGVGDTPAAMDTYPVQVSPTGGLTCYWRMPFRESARIVVTNDNPRRSTGLYWQVDWVELSSVPDDVGYFCAKYRCEYPAVMGRDYVIADIRGSGTYVGTVLSVTAGQDGWFGEGDDFFYIDGEEVPSLQGTGSEDYFNDAWGFRTRTSPWFGQPRWSGWLAGDGGPCYRWHVLDPVQFTTSLKVTIEHKGNHILSEDGWFIERPDFLSSVAFWYQHGEPHEFGELPAYLERTVPWVSIPVLPALSTARVSDGATVGIECDGMFGGRPSLRFAPGPSDSAGGNASLDVEFEVQESGEYVVQLRCFAGAAEGKYRVGIDGHSQVAFDLRDAQLDELEVRIGAFVLGAGSHVLRITTCSDKPIAIEVLRLLKLPVPACRVPRNFNEAHFVGLAIGRAVYAYRLAFSKLPVSLDELVVAGAMSERYLVDENGHVLDASIEDGAFTVVSRGPDAWRRQWRGLDARR